MLIRARRQRKSGMSSMVLVQSSSSRLDLLFDLTSSRFRLCRRACIPAVSLGSNLDPPHAGPLAVHNSHRAVDSSGVSDSLPFPHMEQADMEKRARCQLHRLSVRRSVPPTAELLVSSHWGRSVLRL